MTSTQIEILQYAASVIATVALYAAFVRLALPHIDE